MFGQAGHTFIQEVVAMMNRASCTKLYAGLLLVLLLLVGTAAWADAGRVAFEVDADTPVVMAGEGGKVIVRVLVRPERGEVAARAPLAVALVLDKSGSMASDRKMENAKLGALEALRMLDPNDIATVVVYSDGAGVAVRARPVGRGDREPVFARGISRIQPEGMTALYDGVVLGAQQLESFVREGFIPRIVMLSDGIANVGPSTTRELAALGRKLARNEMTITTIGLGLDYNEDLMTALAAESGGNAYFARNSRMLRDIFARDMEDAVTLTARKMRVTVHGRGGARPGRTIGRAGELDGDTLEVVIDNLYSSDKYALFELELPEGGDGTTAEVAEVVLEFQDPESGERISRTATLNIAFTGMPRRSIKAATRDSLQPRWPGTPRSGGGGPLADEGKGKRPPASWRKKVAADDDRSGGRHSGARDDEGIGGVRRAGRQLVVQRRTLQREETGDAQRGLHSQESADARRGGRGGRR